MKRRGFLKRAAAAVLAPLGLRLAEAEPEVFIPEECQDYHLCCERSYGEDGVAVTITGIDDLPVGTALMTVHDGSWIRKAL